MPLKWKYSPDGHELMAATKSNSIPALAPVNGSTLVNDLAREAWCVLNHDNDWLDTTDPCHAANWERLTKGIRVILKAHKIKA